MYYIYVSQILHVTVFRNLLSQISVSEPWWLKLLMSRPSSVPRSSSFCLISHYFIFYSLASDSFRGQTVKKYIENINLTLLIFTSFAAVFHYEIPFHINQCPGVGHLNESSNIFSCWSIYTQTSVLCL